MHYSTNRGYLYVDDEDDSFQPFHELMVRCAQLISANFYKENISTVKITLSCALGMSVKLQGGRAFIK
jgi:hypothetical protein